MIQLSLPPQTPVAAPPVPRKSKTITLSPRQRLLLHALLHRDVRKCSAAAMDTFRKFGWTSGAGIAFELTDKGRRIAELSELSPPDRSLSIDAV
jgi:hypothetical protein